MHTAVPRERRDHDTTVYRAAALTLLLAALAAFPAQRAAAQAAVPCTAVADDAERLACYDRALRGAAPSATPAPAAPAPRAAPPAATPEPAPPASAAAETRSERRIREPARESAAPPAPPAPAAPTARRAAREDDEPEIMPIVIVSTRALPGRETTFTAQDGTRWVQTDAQRIDGLPDTPFDAEIKPGAMGSYFLVAKDRPRAIRVRPVR
jgi:hypothetical protein